MAQIQGLPRLLSNFDRLSMKDINVQAASAGAEVIRAQASENAPRKTGKLARLEITKVASKSNTRAIVKIGPAKDVYYGLMQELGTIHMAPHPFLGPALETKSQEATRETANVIQFALNAKAQ